MVNHILALNKSAPELEEKLQLATSATHQGWELKNRLLLRFEKLFVPTNDNMRTWREWRRITLLLGKRQ